MQKIVFDSITTKIIKTGKTTTVLHEQWDKKRGKTCKTLTYQDGAKKDPIIEMEIKKKNCQQENVVALIEYMRHKRKKKKWKSYKKNG